MGEAICRRGWRRREKRQHNCYCSYPHPPLLGFAVNRLYLEELPARLVPEHSCHAGHWHCPVAHDTHCTVRSDCSTSKSKNAKFRQRAMQQGCCGLSQPPSYMLIHGFFTCACVRKHAPACITHSPHKPTSNAVHARKHARRCTCEIDVHMD